MTWRGAVVVVQSKWTVDQLALDHGETPFTLEAQRLLVAQAPACIPWPPKVSIKREPGRFGADAAG